MPITLTIGSLHYDIMVEAEHLPRPDETAIGSRWYPKFGGKGGNQAVAAAKAGAESRMIGDVGGIDDRFIATIPDVGSGMSVAIVNAAGDYAATIVSGANLHLSAANLANDAAWDGVGLLILQNEVPEAINLEAAKQAHKRAIPTLLNAAPFRDLGAEFRDLIDILVVNAVEAEMMGTGPVTDLASAARAAQDLAAQGDTVIVTAGGAGLAAVGLDGAELQVAAEKVKVVSSHGAGDAFIGALAVQLAEGAGLDMACRTASQAAARHVAGL